MSESTKSIQVVTRILQANDRVAQENRRRFADAGMRVINVISSPGAGKTSLLEATIPRIRDAVPTAVVVGDIATTCDAERIARLDIPVAQITTESFGGSCHLEASTVRQAVDQLDMSGIRLLIVENVGNLVCPAEFDIGEDRKVVLLSVTEGEDKPLKYPLAFQVADVVLLTKVDLVPHLRMDMGKLKDNVRRINPRAPIIEVSPQTGEGLDTWIGWLQALMG